MLWLSCPRAGDAPLRDRPSEVHPRRRSRRRPADKPASLRYVARSVCSPLKDLPSQLGDALNAGYFISRSEMRRLQDASDRRARLSCGGQRIRRRGWTAPPAIISSGRRCVSGRMKGPSPGLDRLGPLRFSATDLCRSLPECTGSESVPAPSGPRLLLALDSPELGTNALKLR